MNLQGSVRSAKISRAPWGLWKSSLIIPMGPGEAEPWLQWHLLQLVALSVTPSLLNFSLPEEQLPAMVAEKLSQLRLQGEHLASG